MFPVIDRYLFTEVAKTFFGVVAILMIVLISHSFISYLSKVVAGSLSSSVIFTLLSLEMIRYLSVVLGPAFFFSIMLSLGRMYRDNEMTALTASGVGTIRVYRAFLLSTLPLAVLAAYLSFFVEPKAGHMIEVVKNQQEKVAQFSGVAAGRFNEFSRGNLVFYVESMSADGRELHNVFAQNREQGSVGVVAALRGEQYVDPDSGDRYVVLIDGHRYKGIPGQADFTIVEFERYTLRVVEEADTPVRQRYRTKPTRDLMTFESVRDHAELQGRIALPMSVIVFAVMGIPLSRVGPRQGMYGRLFIAALIFTLYQNLQSVGESWIEQEVVPPWLGLWWVHGVFLVGSFWVLTTRTSWYRRLIFTRRRKSKG